MKKNEFLNPYNFIELPEHKRKQYEDTDRHTGVIEYSVTTKTPLFIPNTSSNKAFKISDEKEFSDPEKAHHSYDFYSYTLLKQNQRYDDVYHQPVIPGSEVRGMIRNLYETLTDSCMSGLTVNEIPIKRVPGIFKAGLICKNGENYKLLLNVDSFRIKFREYLPDGKKIYVKKEYKEYKGRNFPGVLTRYSTRPEGPCKSEAYVINWGMGVKKKGSHVFIAKSNSSEIKISKELIEDTLLRVIESYKNQPSVKKSNLNAYKNYESAVKAFLKNNEKGNVYFPVNYSIPIKRTDKNTPVQQGSIVYLSPACITKEAYANNIGKLAGEFAPCKNTNKICPSCALFGTIGEDITSAAASKLRFADLLPEKMQENAKSYYDNIITLQTLGGPKLGNVAFYLKKPDDANFWTYDYYIDKNGDVCIKPGELRGRKYYWHHQNFNYTEGVEATNLNKTIRPVKSGVTFKGKIFFEDISEKQLQELVWIVNGGNTDSTEKEDICYKLGAAKPLGLGSVKCSVSRVLERVVSLQNGTIQYKEENITERYCGLSYVENGFSDTGKIAFLNMCNYHAVPDSIMISYPREEKQMEDKILKEGYLWYQHNQSKLGNSKELQIIEKLPPATDVETLKCHSPKTQNNKDENSKGKSSYGRR